jgi:hypothetical protein
MKVKVKVGDIDAVHDTHNEYGFTQVLLDIFEEKQRSRLPAGAMEQPPETA